MYALPGTLIFLCIAWYLYYAPSQISFGIFRTRSAYYPATTKHVITPELDAFIGELVQNGTVPGLSLGVVHLDKAEFGEWGRRTEDEGVMTADTLFILASCSKAFLSASVGILMDDFAQGRNSTPLPHGLTHFDWYTKVADILPDDWELMDSWASAKATVRDILSHQSGLPRHEFSYTAVDTPLDVVRKMRHLRPAFELRQRYHYNNQMYVLGAHLIAVYSGMSYTDFVKARILDPLDMSSTTFYESEASSGNLTHAWTSYGRRIPFFMSENLVLLNGGPGGVISSSVDMGKWIKMLLNDGVDPITNTTVIPQSAFKMATNVQSIVDGSAKYPEFSFSGYGMGWERFSYQGHEIITHSGGVPGFSTQVLFMPSDRLGIVTLANAASKHAYELAAIYRIIEDTLGLERKHSSRLVSQLRAEVSERQEGNSDARQQEVLSTPSSAHSLDKYAGIYSGPGYPNITLCAPTSTSFACLEALEDFSHFEDVSQSEVIYVIIPSIWISHGRLRHRENNTFGLSATQLYPQGYGRDKSPFEMGDEGEVIAEFVEESSTGEPKVVGVGLKGLVGEMTNRERDGGTVEETAEVYFSKIE